MASRIISYYTIYDVAFRLLVIDALYGCVGRTLHVIARKELVRGNERWVNIRECMKFEPTVYAAVHIQLVPIQTVSNDSYLIGGRTGCRLTIEV